MLCPFYPLSGNSLDNVVISDTCLSFNLSPSAHDLSTPDASVTSEIADTGIETDTMFGIREGILRGMRNLQIQVMSVCWTTQLIFLMKIHY